MNFVQGNPFGLVLRSNGRVNNLRHWVQELLSERSECHGYTHVEQVVINAIGIAREEFEKGTAFKESGPWTLRQYEHMVIVALCHDNWDHKFSNNPEEDKLALKHQMEVLGFNMEDYDQIVADIDNISYSKGNIPETLMGKIAQDADRLEAIGERGLERVRIYGEHAGLDDGHALRHIQSKLIKLRGMMNLESSKYLAIDPHNVLVNYLRERGIDAEEAGAFHPC